MATQKLTHDFAKNFYENEAWKNNRLIVGIDEVGRGCLAGPVVSVAIIITTKNSSHLIADSKTLTARKRDIAFEWIKSNAIWAVGITHHRYIDEANIYQATTRSMQRALNQLLINRSIDPYAILIDAVPLKIPEPTPVYAFCFGEEKSISIAAASIVAKVTRDQIIQSIDHLFPQYGLFSHKGYCTPRHQQAVKSLGGSIIHRSSFIDHFSNSESEKIDEKNRQIEIFSSELL